MSIIGNIPGDGWGGLVIGKVPDTLAEYYQRTWLRVHEDSTRTIYVSPDMGPILEPCYVKALVIPKTAYVAAMRSELAEVTSARLLPASYPPIPQPAQSAPVPAWWLQRQDNASNGNGPGVANNDVNSDLPQDESAEVDVNVPLPPVDQPLDLASFQIGKIQLRILRWLSNCSSEAGQEFAWGVDYRSKDNASRRVVFSRAIKNLEKKGLIDRIRHKDQAHSRTRAVRLTPLGLRVARLLADEAVREH